MSRSKRFLHVSDKIYKERLQPLALRKAKKNRSFAQLDGTNPFPKILFPRLVTCMKRHPPPDESPYEYDVHVSVHERIAPDMLLEMCCLSQDYRRTKLLGSVFADHTSWMDEYSDDEYTPAAGDPAVITDIVREVRFAETGRLTSRRGLVEH
jgi:hypothetical protein